MCAYPTTKEIKNAFPDEKNDALWTRFVLRPLSFPLARLFIRLRLSANQVTYLSILCVVLGAGLFALQSYSFAIIAAIFFNIFALLDCVDGNIARATGGNPYGQWVDALGGYIAYTFLFLSGGVIVEATYGDIWLLGTVDFVLVGAVAAVANLLMRVQHQKFENTLEAPSGNEDNESTDSLQKKVSRNIGITGFLMPFVLVSVLIGVFDWILIFYATFYSGAWAVLTVKNIHDIEVDSV